MDSLASGSGRSHGTTSGFGSATRRLSYASVASGATQSHPIPQTRSGILGHMAATTPHNSYPPAFNTDSGHARRMSGYEHDLGIYGTSRDNAGKMPSLPEYSRKYASSTRAGSDTFFVPSYLRDSRYAAKLESAYAARSRTNKGRSLSSASLGTNVGSTNAHRMAPSHRGMTYDIIETNPPKDEDAVTPLPTRWSSQDKYPGLEVTPDGQDVKYGGSAGKADTEAASVRANYHMSKECGIYYYEIEIKQKTKDCAVAVGFSTQKASLERLPGWEAESWAYHSDDGRAFSGEHHGKNYGPVFGPKDTIGCGINFVTGQGFFTKNGQDLGTAFRDIKNVQPFPSVGIKKCTGAVVTVNFGQRPFLYDIDSHVERERENIRREIKKTKTSTVLHPQLDDRTLIQELVAQYLSHAGHVEAAKAFSRDRKAEQVPLHATGIKSVEVPALEETDAAHRQQIRKAILQGDVDRAFEITNRHFPTVLQTSPEIVFRLKCRKWVELISRASDLRARQVSPVETRRKGRSGTVEDVFDQHMELDEEERHSTKGTSVFTSSEIANDLAYNDLLNEAMHYGQILQREYRESSTLEHKKALADIFSLVAYNEPRESVHGHLLDVSGRIRVAEELNGEILVSLGKPRTAALENMYRQTEALIDVLSRRGGPATFVNLRSDFSSS